MPRVLCSSLIALAIAFPAPTQTSPRSDRCVYLSAYERTGVHHARLSGRVVDHDGAAVANARVLLYGYQPFYWALPLADTTADADGAFVLDDVSGDGRLIVWAVTPADRAFARGSRPVTLVSGRASTKDVQLEAPGQVPDAVTVRGSVRAADDTPMSGAYLRLEGERERFDPFAFADVGRDGRFEITSRTGAPASASLFLPGCKFPIKHDADHDTLTKGRLTEWLFDLARAEWNLKQAVFETYLVEVKDHAEDAELSVERGGRWHACGPRVATMKSEYQSAFATVRARIPGHVARMLTIAGPTTFDFSDSVPLAIEVSRGATPVAGARVDLCVLTDEFDSPWVDTARSDAEGRVALAAPRDVAYEVYAYADGCAPARGIWRSGTLRLDLVPLSAHLRVAAADGTSSIFVRPASSFVPAAVVYPEAGQVADVPLAPGRYEVMRSRADKSVCVETVDLAAAATVDAQVDVDRRPTVLLTLPPIESKDPKDTWWARGSRSAISGMIAKWAAYHGKAEAPFTHELVAVVEPVEGNARQFLLRFPISGRFTIYCGHRALRHRYFTDVDLALGDQLEIELPALDGAVTAEVKGYPDGWVNGLHHEGIAGPRFLLRPARDGASCFGVMVALPEPARFELQQIPAGSYVLEHHLYETGLLVAKKGTFGGRLVQTAAGATTDLGTLDDAGSAVEVEVVDRDGKPIAGRLAIRDRMFESWHKVVEEGTSLNLAEDPIPTPPTVLLDEHGHATLPSVRTGRLELVLTTPDGRRVFCERDVTTGTDQAQRLQIDLPAPR